MKNEKYNIRRDRVLNAIPKRLFKGHYNPIPVLKKGATYSMIIALRNNGKSTAMAILILYAWQYFNYPSCWIRRLRESLTARNISTLFNTAFKIVPNKKKYDGIIFKSGTFVGYWENEKGKKKYDAPFCYTQSLSSQESQKGTKDIKDLMFIVFDEFMSREYYLTNEFVTFVNTLSTVFRECYDASVVMLANPVSWKCPYFDEMGIKDVRKIPQGTIKLYKAENSNTSVALEMCGENQRNIHTDVINDRFFGFKNNQIESIRSGAWELPMYPHLDHDDNNDRLLDRSCYIQYDNDLLVIEIREKADKSLYAFIRPYTNELDITSPEIYRVYQQRTNEGVKHYKVSTKIRNDKCDMLIWKKLYVENRMFYATNLVGETVRLFLNDYVNQNFY